MPAIAVTVFGAGFFVRPHHVRSKRVEVAVGLGTVQVRGSFGAARRVDAAWRAGVPRAIGLQGVGMVKPVHSARRGPQVA